MILDAVRTLLAPLVRTWPRRPLLKRKRVSAQRPLEGASAKPSPSEPVLVRPKQRV